MEGFGKHLKYVCALFMILEQTFGETGQLGDLLNLNYIKWNKILESLTNNN